MRPSLRLSSVTRLASSAATVLLLALAGCGSGGGELPADPDGGSSPDAPIADAAPDRADAGGAGGPDGAPGGDGGRGDAGPPPDARPRPDGAGGGACVDPASPLPLPPAAPVTVTAAADWKGTISLDEPLFAFVGDSQSPRWIKFTVFLRDLTKVYFQNSQKYRYHYDFATARLDPLKGKTRAEFDRVALGGKDQEVVLGAVLIAPFSAGVKEYGVQLVGSTPYHPELVRRLFELVRSKIGAPPEAKAFYFPTYEQSTCLAAHAPFFAERGIEVGDPARWTEGNACYAFGWALGRVVKLPAGEITAAYKDGRLRPTDVLLTDAVPAEIPFVAGVLSLSASTPNSHVAILAKAERLPFAHLHDPADAARANALVGKRVLLRVDPRHGEDGGCSVRLLDGDALPEAARAELLAKKVPAPIAYVKKAPRGALSASTNGLGPADVKHFGGKAAGYGILRQAIPAAAQEGIALSFDLWDGFMGQALPGGKTLGQEIAARLVPFSTFPPDFAALDTALAGIRELVRKQADFTPAQRQAIAAALAPFDPKRNLRFRSSSNVEDDGFTGAGLYDSYSGCLADDTDADDAGPSACDPTEADERGVHRAIKRVFASFYNLNAYLERLRHGVNEAEVGMAILVHHSVPDALELANGVATYRSQGSAKITLVSHPGAHSIANPDGGARPEIVEVSLTSFRTGVSVVQGSALAVLGQTVLENPREYEALAALFKQVADRFAAVTGAKPPFLLDFEYKKVMRPGGAALEVKQVRRIPMVDPTAEQTTFLVNEPARLCTFQGEHGTVFANHRLKSRWTLEARPGWLTPGALAAGLVERATVELVSGGAVTTLEGAPASFPGHRRQVDGAEVAESFVPAGGDGRTWRLVVPSVPKLPLHRSPIVALADSTISTAAAYVAPVPTLQFQGGSDLGTTTSEDALLAACTDEAPLPAGSSLVEKAFTGPGGLRIETAYHFPPPPRGPTAGYTAPLVKWKETKISGLAAAPIVLRGFFSQSFRPDHHNFGADYIFEPRLEPGLPASVAAELLAKDVVYLFVDDQDGGEVQIWIGGKNGALRKAQ
jgi:hypothetical protein